MDFATKFALLGMFVGFVMFLPTLLTCLWALKYCPNEEGLEKVKTVLDTSRRFWC